MPLPSSDPNAARLSTIATHLQRLRGLSQRDVKPTWHRSPSSAAHTSHPADNARWQDWPLATLNERQHIAWPRGKAILWLHQRFTWPEQLNDYPLEGLTARLALRWWAEVAEIYINNKLVQSGDLFDCWTRILLTDQVSPGQSIDVSLKLISPAHDDGALVTSQLIFESADASCPEPGFVADELEVLRTYLEQLAPDEVPALAHALDQFPWHHLSQRQAFDQSLEQLRQSLGRFSPWLKQRTIHCLGHAHLDLAWLWPVADTWKAAKQTFTSVLKLQQDFPDLTFSHSSPALFEWLEYHTPDLFRTIQQQVQQGNWAIDAGLWVEPDLNLPGGEAMVRHILYGQRYCLEKFGHVSAISWLPDSFGFSWQLPQLLTLGSIKFFATQKLRWNDTTTFPHQFFTWQGLDNTTIAAITLPPIGTDIDPVAMAAYACEWETQTRFKDCLWLPGVGDHGGGPTRDMLTKAQRWARSPFFPTLTFSHAVPLFEKLHQQAQTISGLNQSTAVQPGESRSVTQTVVPPSMTLPIWQDELYLELHRGCYTTHGDQKAYNRRCEDALYQAELLASLVTIQGLAPYPKRDLENAWKQALFNQFHDILPGSAIPEVFADANKTWQQSLTTSEQILRHSLAVLGQQIALPAAPSPEAIPVVLFNPLNWARSEVVTLPIPPGDGTSRNWQAQTATGDPLKTQLIQPTDPADNRSLLVFVPNIPSVGYYLIWLTPIKPPIAAPALPVDWILDNAILKVRIDPTTGTITSLLHQPSGQETFRSPGNELHTFTDQGQYWDAWNIAPDYQDHPVEGFSLRSIAWLECGPLRQTIRIIKTFNRSTFVQDYTLDYQSPKLDIYTQVHWHETQILIKTAFPLTISAPYASYEIPYGAIQRATVPQTPNDAAKWEVPALRWADLSNSDFGVSILTDYKHGFDATPNQLNLTLLKAPLWPDPQADRGQHRFRYSIYPHQSRWQTAQTVRLAHVTNLPILAAQLVPLATEDPNLHGDQPSSSVLPTSMSFLHLGDDTLVLSALKLAETKADQFILRCYESTGTHSTIRFNSPLAIDLAAPLNLLEENQDTNRLQVNHGEANQRPITPWQIATFAIETVTATPPHNAAL
jgi:alpha-mannosidase